MMRMVHANCAFRARYIACQLRHITGLKTDKTGDVYETIAKPTEHSKTGINVPEC